MKTSKKNEETSRSLLDKELLKEKKEGDKKWFQENQIRKKKELEDFANAWEAEGLFVARRDSMK